MENGFLWLEELRAATLCLPSAVPFRRTNTMTSSHVSLLTLVLLSAAVHAYDKPFYYYVRSALAHGSTLFTVRPASSSVQHLRGALYFQCLIPPPSAALVSANAPNISPRLFHTHPSFFPNPMPPRLLWPFCTIVRSRQYRFYTVF